MDFTLSDEQQQLRDTLARYVAKGYAFEQRKQILKSKDGISPEAWKQLAEMGLTALGLPEELGGLPGNAVDTMVVMEVFGRGLVVEPYLATVVLGAGLVAAAGSDAQKGALLPKVAEGSLLLALASDEDGARYQPTHVKTAARKQGETYAITGDKTVVLHGAQAHTLIVSAGTSGHEHDDKGVSLFIVDRTAPGITVRDYPTHDGMRAADIAFSNARGTLLGKEGQGASLLEFAQARGIAALCAEAVGAMSAITELTLTYVKQRKQFGVPIGSFQVLQHRMADMLMYVENARSMMLLAAARADSADIAERRRAIHAAKAYIGQASRFVGQQAVQLHGGIGVTDEASVSHYFKRLTLINASFGDADHHLGKFSDLLLPGAEAPARASQAA
ncbi:MAG TPA: acyl-CoA dehydrogenase family protein [Verrucomicrobiae bacterium]|nr:acyl-CoA dehydrogenase family protein [Verrucomicrobiae bacterium]